MFQKKSTSYKLPEFSANYSFGIVPNRVLQKMNETFEEEWYLTNLTLDHCKTQYANQTALLLETHADEFCGVTFDKILCWPPTLVNQTATTKCFTELFNIKYDHTRKY